MSLAALVVGCGAPDGDVQGVLQGTVGTTARAAEQAVEPESAFCRRVQSMEAVLAEYDANLGSREPTPAEFLSFARLWRDELNALEATSSGDVQAAAARQADAMDAVVTSGPNLVDALLLLDSPSYRDDSATIQSQALEECDVTLEIDG